LIKFLSSVKLAVSLIALLVISSILATIYPEADIYSSFWFRGLLLFFTLNLLVCTLKRIPGIITVLKKDPESISNQNISGNKKSLEDIDKCENKLKEYFRGKKYKIQEQKEQGQTKLLAQKGFLNLLAPHMLHLALIIVLVGAFLGSFGAKGKVLCYVGQEREVPKDVAADMFIEVNDFKTIYDQQGAVSNWVTDFNIYVADKKVKTGTTKVNHPLKYKGVVFYQSSYGYNHLIQVLGEKEEAYAVPDGKVFKLDDLFFNISNVENGALLKVYQGHEVIKSKILQPGDKISFSDKTTLEYLQLHTYTVLSVKKDPGTNIVMAGFLLMSMASALFWTGRYTEIKVLTNKQQNEINFNVSCKNKTIKAEIIEEITKIVQGD